ncbi:MAG: cytochrome P450, partial [Pseudomonadota bacterium]
PEHTRLRGLVFKTFSARRMEAMRPRIQNIADGLIDKVIEQGEMDIMRDFAHPLPAIVICELLGIPEADRSQFVTESKVNGRILDPTPMSPEELEETNAGFLEMEAYFADICEQRRQNPQDDLLTALVQSETEDGKLNKEELVANIFLLFGAGHETTVNLIGNGLLALCKNPEQLELLKSDFSLMPNAVEEFLRYDSSVQLTSRVAFEDVELGDQTIPANSEVLTLLGAGNRDPEVFPEPDKLDITRPGVKPLSFGGGIHFCLGAQLARIEGAIALETILRRLPNLQLANLDKPDWKITMTLRGLTTLPATW